MFMALFSREEYTNPRRASDWVIRVTPLNVTAGCSGSNTTRFMPLEAKSKDQRNSRRQLGRVK
jgi:hypothetical protein